MGPFVVLVSPSPKSHRYSLTFVVFGVVVAVNVVDEFADGVALLLLMPTWKSATLIEVETAGSVDPSSMVAVALTV